MTLVVIGLLVVVFALVVFWVIGQIGCQLRGIDASHGKATLIGFASSVISGFLFGFLERVLPRSFIDDDYAVLGGLIVPFLVAYVLIGLFGNESSSKKEEEVKNPENAKDGKEMKNDNKEKKEKDMNDLNIKSLIRIPVWALYSLIVATVIMSFVMLIKIWFPETINEELIWRIILSYGVFLVSALVISNLTDKIKTMKTFENEK